MPIKGFRKIKSPCSVDGCDRLVKSDDLCAGHYQRRQLGHAIGGPFVKLSAIERFMDRVLMCPMSGCWWWTGQIINTGYGSFVQGGRNHRHLAHRWIWAHINGPIPDGLCVLHQCDNGKHGCVAPHHLFLGTQADNIHDMIRKGRQAWVPKAAHAD